jgi:Ca-activated chloride channel homolog
MDPNQYRQKRQVRNLLNKRYLQCGVPTVFLVFFYSVVVQAQALSSRQNEPLKIDVNLVLVNASISDSRGRMITGLQQKNFQLWEDKVEQNIEYFSSEDTPVSIGLIFDATGSMLDNFSAARDAAATFLKGGNLEDEYFLVTFSEAPRLVADFTTDISRLQTNLLFTPAKGLTPLFDAVYLGLENMRHANNKRKALLLITDGQDNHSRYSFEDVKAFVKEQDVQIFAIGIVNPSGELALGETGRSIIEDLVQITGGQAFFPDSVDQLEDVCRKISSELRSQYVLGYHSTNEVKDGKWRKIHLKVNPPKGLSGLLVHEKSGYYAEMLNPNHETFQSSRMTMPFTRRKK